METREIIIALIISSILSYVLSLLSAKLAYKYNIFNDAGGRNFKEKKIPRTGGMAIVISLFISLILIRIFFSNIFKEIDENISYPLFFLAVFIIFVLGIYDDLKGAAAYKKFILQITAAVIIYFAGFKIAEISIPFIGTKSLGFNFLPFLLTILWVVGITNAVNIMDGLDGLAVGVSFFAALSLGVLALLSFQYHAVVIIAVLMGAMMGFYPFNFPKAKIYLGDSGSLVIGFMLAVLSMAKIHRKVSLAMALMIPIIILFLPILETLVTITRRIYKKQNIFIADTDHFHYRFLKKGFSEKKTAVLLISISFLFSLAGILFEFIQPKLRLMFFIIIGFTCLFLLSYLGYYNLFPKRKNRVPRE